MNLAKFLNQKAVYWSSPVPDGWGGSTYGDPVEVDVRWTEKQELYLRLGGSGGDNTIEEKLSKVVVLAQTDFEWGGRMMLGTLTDLSSDEDPDTNNALTIDGFSKIPDIKAASYLRKAWLA